MSQAWVISGGLRKGQGARRSVREGKRGREGPEAIGVRSTDIEVGFYKLLWRQKHKAEGKRTS